MARMTEQQLADRTAEKTAGKAVSGRVGTDGSTKPRKKRAEPERAQQMAFVEWARRSRSNPKYPGLWLLHSSLNGAKRTGYTGGREVKSGMLKGVCDLFLPVGRMYSDGTANSGLYIEMKTPGNKPTPEQVQFILGVTEQGFKCVVCYSAAEAIQAVNDYYGVA